MSRAWTSASVAEADLPPAGLVPRRLGPTPPGLVLSNPESPMLAGAVALAAGRFQPLVRLDPVPATATAATGEAAAGWPSKRFHDVLPLAEARGLARLIESRAAAVARPHDRLGDACDFLTLAADWPYRYRNDAEVGLARGEHALDDLIGRVLDTDEGGLASSRSRWAFTGRLLGDPAASVYRAMCALFLQPEESLLWDTYEDGAARSAYRMTEAAATLERLWPGKPAPVHRAGDAADLSAWHQALDPVNRFGWIMVNSSGIPRRFSISGGSGCPADLPRGRPVAVAIIHSYSAADPLDVSTLAGRWLENGAFVYYGSMNEPYLPAFRPPKLVAELAAAEMPLERGPEARAERAVRPPLAPGLPRRPALSLSRAGDSCSPESRLPGPMEEGALRPRTVGCPGDHRRGPTGIPGAAGRWDNPAALVPHRGDPRPVPDPGRGEPTGLARAGPA